LLIKQCAPYIPALKDRALRRFFGKGLTKDRSIGLEDEDLTKDRSIGLEDEDLTKDGSIG